MDGRRREYLGDGLGGIVMIFELGIDALLHLIFAQSGSGPGDEALLAFGHGMVDGLPPREEFEQHHSEAVDVALLGDLAGHGVLGSVVAEGAEDAGGVEASSGVGGLVGEAEVGDLGQEVVEEEDVAGADVAVDDGGLAFLMQKLQPFGCAERDLHSLVPAEDGAWLRPLHALPPVQHVVQGPHRRVFVAQDSVVSFQAVAQQPQEVLVLQPRHHRQLASELALRILRLGARVQLLDGGRLPLARRGVVHPPVRPFSD